MNFAGLLKLRALNNCHFTRSQTRQKNVSCSGRVMLQKLPRCDEATFNRCHHTNKAAAAAAPSGGSQVVLQSMPSCMMCAAALGPVVEPRQM